MHGPQVHARPLDLVTSPRVCFFSFRSVSGCSPHSLFSDDHVLFCHELVGIMHKNWHVESVCFEHVTKCVMPR